MKDNDTEGVAVTRAFSEGRRTLSWIWFAVSSDEDLLDVHEGALTLYFVCHMPVADCGPCSM
jgi:hypothetical protein